MNDDLKPQYTKYQGEDFADWASMDTAFDMAMLIVLRFRDTILEDASGECPIPREDRSMVAGALTCAFDLIKEVADAWSEQKCS